MAKEYIERDALMKYPIRIDHYDKENGNEDFVLGIESVLEYAENIPAADVVEVTRCRNCKHWHEETGWCGKHSHFIKYGTHGEEFCHPWESADWKMFDADYWCADGERRDDE